MLRNPIDRVGVVVVAGISAVGYFGGIRPLLAHQADRLITERAVETKRAQLERQEAQQTTAEARVEDLEAQLRQYREGFTASPRVNERIGELAELTKLVGVSVSSIKPADAVEGDGYTLRSISISGSGTPDSVATLLSELRRVFPDMGVRGFSVGAGGGESSSLSADLVWFAGQSGSADSAGEPER